MLKLRWLAVTFAVCLLLASGCVSSTQRPPRLWTPNPTEIDVNVYVSSVFDAKERDTIIDGINMWERAARGMIRWQLMTFDGDGVVTPTSDAEYKLAVVFWKASSDTDWVMDWDKQHNNTLYGIYHHGSIWLVEDRLTDRDTKVVVAAHEFGHALGLPHVEQGGSVMSAHYRPTTKCLTGRDLREFCDRYPCLLDEMTAQCAP